MQTASHCPVDPKTVFANNEMDLSTIDVYGFDYDYTLACYTCELHHLIYQQAMENLIERRKVIEYLFKKKINCLVCMSLILLSPLLILHFHNTCW